MLTIVSVIFLGMFINIVIFTCYDTSPSFETLSKLVIELKQTEFNLNNGDYVIKEYCNELKRKVQLGKEIKIVNVEN